MSKLELDDQILNHPKFIRAVKLGGAETVFLWLGIRAYCGQLLTDGFVPSDMLDEVRGPLNAKKRAAALQVLVEVRLLDPCDGGFRMHDFLDWSRSKAQVLADRERARERQARSRGMSRRDSPGDFGDRSGCVTMASASASGSASGSSDLQGGSKPVRSDPAEAPPDPPRVKDPFGDSFASLYPEPAIEPTETHRELCAKRGLDLENEIGKHRAWAKKNRRLCLDWSADFELWIRNSRVKPQGGKTASGGPSEDWPTDRDLSLRERIRAGEFGDRLRSELEAGKLDASLARRRIAERATLPQERVSGSGRPETRPANESAPNRNLASLTANLGRVPQ